MAAQNPGGAAGAGVGLGAGIALGQRMTQSMGTSPPAPTSPAVWSLAIEGKMEGPHTVENLRGMVRGGQVTAGTLAWKPGAAGWAALCTYPEFADLATPPPLPPDKPA